MGLLNKWFKKKEEKQLQEVAEKGEKVVVEAKKTSKSKTQAEKVEAVLTQAPKKDKPAVSSAMAGVIVRPLVTEKGAAHESEGKYGFVVRRDSNKNQIKMAVEALYGVKPVSVRVMNVQGRWVRFGKNMGRRSDYKKAIVTLPKGKTISLHTGV